MRTRQVQIVATAASPAAPGTLIVSPTLKHEMFYRAETLSIDSIVRAGTGGTLDLYLQRRIDVNMWLDWIHFPQVIAGATSAFTLIVDGSGNYNNPIVMVGLSTDATASPALAANGLANTLPTLNSNVTSEVRLVMVAGAGTSAAGSVSVYVSPLTQRM